MIKYPLFEINSGIEWEDEYHQIVNLYFDLRYNEFVYLVNHTRGSLPFIEVAESQIIEQYEHIKGIKCS